MRTVAAVIVTYDNEYMLERLLNDLAAQTVLLHEIFVMDNSVNGRTARLMKERFPQVRYTGFRANRGSAGGYHEGIRQAAGTNDLVWLFDDDVIVPPDSLENLLKGLERLDPNLSGCVVRSWCTGTRLFSQPGTMRGFAWRGTLIPAEIIRRVGLPRRDYFLYCDDTEYSMRIADAGYPMYWIPDSLVLEQRQSDRQDLALAGIHSRVYAAKEKLYYAFRNQFNLFMTKKMRCALVRTLLYGLKVMTLIICSGGRGKLSRLAAVMRGLMDGAQGRLGINPFYTPGENA